MQCFLQNFDKLLIKEQSCLEMWVESSFFINKYSLFKVEETLEILFAG